MINVVLFGVIGEPIKRMRKDFVSDKRMGAFQYTWYRIPYKIISNFRFVPGYHRRFSLPSFIVMLRVNRIEHPIEIAW